MRIFILGSCVTRDAFRLKHDFEIVDYVARTSLASAFAGHEFAAVDDLLLEKKIPSSFQRRMVEIDIKKKLKSLLSGSDYDLIVFDLIDERFDLIEIDGALATLSSEFSLTEVHKREQCSRLTPDDTHRMKLWEQGLAELISISRSNEKRIILNKVFYSSHDDLGAPFHLNHVAQSNARLSDLYNRVPPDVETVDYDSSLFIGDTNHVWGRSPFHYCSALYQHLLANLEGNFDRQHLHRQN